MTPGLPNYQCLAYRQSAPLLAYLDDVFQGSEAWLGRDETGAINITEKARIYLTPDPAEDGDDYLARLKASPFDDRFSQSIREFVSLIISNGVKLEDIPPVMEAHLSNLDNCGGTLARVMTELAIKVLSLGHTFVLVDFPAVDPSIRSQADFERSGRRPRWVHYSPRNIIHWKTSTVNGEVKLSQVTLREKIVVADGDFGEVEVERFRVLRPGRFDVWTIEKDRQGKEVAIHHPDESGVSGFVQNGVIIPFDFIPLVPIYGGLREGFFASRPPLKALADLNITHYRVKSDHLRKVHLCCMPVPELRDSMRGEDEPLKLGPNSFVHIRDPQGSFNWKEPLATSLEQSRREVLDLQGSMDLLSASYLLNPSDRQAAATTNAQVTKLESNLQAFADQFSEGINNCLKMHARYLKLSSGGTVKLSGDIIKDAGKDSQLLMALTNLAAGDIIDKRTTIEELKRREFLTESVDVDEVIRRVGEQIQFSRVEGAKSQPL